MEGRDIGTVVFPDAPLKFFLTADPMVRAQRRAAELAGRGETVDVAELGRELVERDRRDRARATAPLKPADDAIELDTSTLALDAVIDEMERAARGRLSL
jgi:cytidylate kinase